MLPTRHAGPPPHLARANAPAQKLVLRYENYIGFCQPAQAEKSLMRHRAIRFWRTKLFGIFFDRLLHGCTRKP